MGGFPGVTLGAAHGNVERCAAVIAHQRSVAFESDQVRANLHGEVHDMIDSLTFEDKCRLLRIVSCDSDLCVETAADPGRAIVPVRKSSGGVPSWRYAIGTSRAR